MSREIEILAREFRTTPVKVMRKDVNLYQTNIQTASSTFLKSVETECKRLKEGKVVLVAIIED